MNIKLYPSGQTTAFDDAGKQVPIAQKSWLVLYAEYLSEQGIDPTRQNIELENTKVRIIETDDGYSWKLWKPFSSFMKRYRDLYNQALPPKQTLKTMALKLGFESMQGYYYLETGKREFTPEEIAKAAEIFGKTVEELMAEYEAWVLREEA